MKLVFEVAPLARGNFDAKPLHVVLEWLGDAHDILGNNGDAEDTRQKGTAGGFPEQDDVALKSEGLEALLGYGHKRFDGTIGDTQYCITRMKCGVGMAWIYLVGSTCGRRQSIKLARRTSMGHVGYFPRAFCCSLSPDGSCIV